MSSPLTFEDVFSVISRNLVENPIWVAKKLSAQGIDSARLEEVVARFKKSEPIEYILGEVDFYNITLKCDARALIPRIETEKLIELALAKLSNTKYDLVFDIGTGSGAIVLSLVKAFFALGLETTSPTRFFGLDISKDALELAKGNALLNNLEADVEFIESDLLGGEKVASLLNRSNLNILVIANLPYIPTSDYNALDASVKAFEPRIALDGGVSGLDPYYKLEDQLSEYPFKQADVLYELDITNIHTKAAELAKNKCVSNIEVIRDTFDRERFLSYSLNPSES